MSIEEQITNLIEKYKTEPNKNQTEADIQAGYIDQLFLALGWNVYNDPGQFTNYRRQGYIRGAGIIDVGLEIANEPVLILEAKRFGVIPRSIERAGDRTTEEKQLFRYARSRRIPFGILTNFERLHVFNADHERLILAFDDPKEYLNRLPELLRLSPDKVKAGSLPAWERQLEIRDIDETFLTSLQRWRLLLANAVYQHNLSNPVLQTNGEFDFDKLMAAVQRILDRLILIRFADDKEVLLIFDVLESVLSYYRRLGAYVGREHLMQEFIRLSQVMDEHHNTTLFQKGHICEQVFIPNDILAQIMEEMSSISFRKFTSDILGNTYETYLGTKLVLKNGEIKSEERRDIRKAGGIFYTPPVIVHYIVDNTLGYLLQKLENENGLQAIEKAQTIRVLDPACGSGSFLIYAYQILAYFYRRMNQRIEDEQMKLLSSGTGADMFDRLEKFKHLPKPLLDYPHHVLRNQLFGVDIDPEAAELAAVNLTMQAFADAKREKLPLILGENIKVGNSLISGTEEELRQYFGNAWQEKKPFNWEEEFPQVMEEGGFDVVIGNPPYGADFDDNDRSYIEACYPFSKSNKNSAMVFIERGLSLTKENGLFSFIVPKSLAFSQKWASGRKLIGNRLRIACDTSKAFKEVLLEQMIIVVSPSFSDQVYYKMASLDGDIEKVWGSVTKLVSRKADSILLSVTDKELTIFSKVVSPGLFLKDVTKSTRGLPFQKYVTKDPNGIPVYRGDHIGKYILRTTDETLPESILVKAREKVSFLRQPKILSQRIVAHVQHPFDHIILMSTLDTDGVITLDTVENTIVTNDRFAPGFITALLNSNFLSWYAYRFIFSKAIRTMDFDNYYVGKLPLPRIDFDNPADKKRHDDLVALVDRMLELNKRLAPIRNTACREREELLREIKRTDEEIDNLVYDLYGLTEKEKRIVEAAIKG